MADQPELPSPANTIHPNEVLKTPNTAVFDQIRSSEHFSTRLRLVQGRQIDFPSDKPGISLADNVIDLTSTPQNWGPPPAPLESPFRSLVDSLHLPQGTATPIRLAESEPSLWRDRISKSVSTDSTAIISEGSPNAPDVRVATLETPTGRPPANDSLSHPSYVDIRAPHQTEQVRTDSAVSYDFALADEQWTVGTKRRWFWPLLIGFVAINSLAIGIGWAASNRLKQQEGSGTSATIQKEVSTSKDPQAAPSKAAPGKAAPGKATPSKPTASAPAPQNDIKPADGSVSNTTDFFDQGVALEGLAPMPGEPAAQDISGNTIGFEPGIEPLNFETGEMPIQ